MTFNTLAEILLCLDIIARDHFNINFKKKVKTKTFKNIFIWKPCH